MFLRRLGPALLLLAGASSAWGAASVTGINQVSATRVGRTTYNYTYTINVSNGASALANAVATVTSNAAATTIIQGTVSLGTLAANASITSTNTFTLQQNRLVQFDPTQLVWTVTGTALDVVPNVVGLSQSAAGSAFTGAGLVLGSISQQSSTSVASGNVISESPVAGTQVTAGSAVSVVVSSGPQKTAVPNVVGLSQSAAGTAFTGAGLVLGSVSQQSSTSVASGNVISESPVAGTQVTAGSAVSVVVSSGPVMVSVPVVTGLTQAAADTSIVVAGLVVGATTTQSSSTVPSGEVVSEGPPAGTLVNVGSAVSIVVSTGPAQVTVPNVVGLSQASATTAITADSLVVGSVSSNTSTTIAAGDVISESPGAGASVSPGASVSLIVSSGPPTVAVPNVVSLSQASATTAVMGAGLLVGTITSLSSSSVAVGAVISESPTAGTFVVDGSAVNLVISTGPSAYQGNLLSGNSSSLAIGATASMLPIPSTTFATNNATVLLDRLEVYFSTAATIAQVNAAIQSVNGSIVGMSTGGSSLVLAVPAAASVDALGQLAASIALQPGILAANPGTMRKAEILPDTPTGLAPLANVQHLAAARFPAAFNVLNNLGTLNGSCSTPQVFIADYFDANPYISPLHQADAAEDWSTRVTNFTYIPIPGQANPADSGTPLTWTTHGDWVSTTLAATYSLGGGPLGLVGASPCNTRVTGINTTGLTGQQPEAVLWLEAKLALDAQAVNVIISNSTAFVNDCGTDPTGAAIACSSYQGSLDPLELANDQLEENMDLPYERAKEALDWREALVQTSQNTPQPYYQRLLVVQSAGNEFDESQVQIWPGMGNSSSASPLALAGTNAPSLVGSVGSPTFLTSQNDWGNAAGGFEVSRPALTTQGLAPVPYPSLVPNAQQISEIAASEAKIGTMGGTTLVVGSLPAMVTTGAAMPHLDVWLNTVKASAFSNQPPEEDTGTFVYAVGENVAVTCYADYSFPKNPNQQCNSVDGTSFAAPQVAGLAALIWTLDSLPQVAKADGDLPSLPLAPVSDTVSLIATTARPAPNLTAGVIDALAAVLSLDQPQAVTPATAPVRAALLDLNGNGTFEAEDVVTFIANYYEDPTRFVAFQPKSTAAPDFGTSDLNGDGYTGVWTTTTFDLDPTGSTQRGAPLLNVISEKLPDGHILHFDETAVSDLDVMCYYAYSGLFDATTDASGSIRNGLGCDAVVIMAETGDTLTSGSDGSATQTIESIDPKVSVNKSGAIAFSESNTNNSSSGVRVDSAHAPYPVSFSPATNRSYGGASLNDAPGGPQAAFVDQFSGAPPTTYVRRWNADGSTIETDIATSAGSVDFAAATDYVDMNDAGVVVFAALDPSFTFEQLLAGDGAGTPVSDLQTLASFVDGPSVKFRPQIASTNDVVYMDGTGDIVVTRWAPLGAGVPRPVASAPAFSNLSDRPGISADGNWVAFAGTETTLGSSYDGVFLAAAVAGGSVPSYAITYNGSTPLLYTGPGGDPSGTNAQFNSFGIRPSAGSDGTRFGIAATPSPDGTGINVSMVFVASRTYLSTATTVYGVYHLTALATGSGAATAYSNIQIDPIVETLQTLPDGTGVTRTVEDFDLWDPISKNGEYAGFWVQFKETYPTPTAVPIQAVVRRHL